MGSYRNPTRRDFIKTASAAVAARRFGFEVASSDVDEALANSGHDLDEYLEDLEGSVEVMV